MKIIKAHQTCHACPSQWDAWDEKGNYWYLRFRHGYGSASRDIDGPDIYTFDAGADGLNGVIDLEDFCTRAGIELAVGMEQTSVYDYWPYTNMRQPDESDNDPVL